MSRAKDHADRARAALAQARRFLDATRHAGSDDGRGSAWGMMNLDARIMNASTGRMFAELAIHEAAHARSRTSDGPTDLQTECSKVADRATRLTEQLAYDISRGALRPTDHTVLAFGRTSQEVTQ